MNSDSDTENDDALAHRLVDAWDEGRGTSKSQLEIQTWNDATSHGRHFDRFVRGALGVNTNRPSRQTDRIAELEHQVRRLGGLPAGTTPSAWEVQLQHARESCLTALRIWNDPVASFRTGAFALLFVTAWNSLAIAVLQQNGREWRKVDSSGVVRVSSSGAEQSRETTDLVDEAFGEAERRGLRENIKFWVDLRNSVAHRHLPVLDVSVIPFAQAGLLNLEDVLVTKFGPEYALAEHLNVPLQLGGFRDPQVLATRKRMQSSLPLDVQAVLSRAESAPPELLSDESFVLRVAFVPVVPASGRNPDAVSYFVRPGEVPTELTDALQQYLVLPKVAGLRPNLAATHVMAEVQRRTGFRFHSQHHVAAARALGARPPANEGDRTVDVRLAEYITSFKRYLYSQAWIDLLADRLSGAEGFEEVTGRPAKLLMGSEVIAE